MNELEKTARELILAIMEKTLKSLKNKGLLKEPSQLQMLGSSPEIMSLIKKPSPPKYDPARPFRKGDIVEVKPSVGKRPQFLYLEEDETHGVGPWVVQADEEHGEVSICYNGERCARVWYNMLKLVTPVEELTPYSVGESTYYFCVAKNDEDISTYWKDTHPNPKAGAAAECARLNAEWRKERSHD
jgi:hypothetical protein